MLKDLLSKRLPHIQFEFEKFFSQRLKKPAFLSRIDAVIAELKALESNDLKLLDVLWKRLRSRPSILVLTPQGYQLLSKRRPQILAKAVVLLSELKSLDYFIQLPRLIKDIAQKIDLRMQNERLLKLVRSATDSLEASTPEELPREILISSRRETQCGLQIRIEKWPRIKRTLGTFGQIAVVDSLGRMINTAVRNSDRVLHSKENEFIVFLSNAEPKHVKLCKARLEKSLESLELFANQKKLSLPFIIQPLE